MILGSPAQTAGVEQGDQLLGIDEMQVDGQSPFQAASAISGGDAEPDSIPEPTVRLQVQTDAGTVFCKKYKDGIFYFYFTKSQIDVSVMCACIWCLLQHEVTCG